MKINQGVRTFERIYIYIYIQKVYSYTTIHILRNLLTITCSYIQVLHTSLKDEY